ncbi:MAG: hypothetical protein B7Z08_06305 [Sphingomonadales bacterium 32-68-7]|nr:MAG: hypothetical protein B7Z33_12155 [Sphingomonadales bacterium 12-68-11]OYX09143.1 MAG: hypothetical protein B7Z08_06305 [Sphingomonadales bacterium 32-68-7]
MTAPSPTISFVIPTLNFAQFLPETLDSIVDEGHAPIEIVVFDGGSTDNTLDVLEAYRRDRFPDLKVLVATEHGNIDIDLNKAVAAATGDYVWTLSADDALMPGWSQAIRAELTAAPDLLLVPAIHCDVNLRPRRNYPILRDDSAPYRTRIANDADLFAYLGRVRTSEGLFSFCSATIVRRERLLQVPLLEDANGTCWRYSARLIAVLTRYPSSIAILVTPLLLKRGDNDSFSQAGPVRRLKIATQNWDHAIRSLGLGSEVSSALASHAKADIRPTTLLFLTQFVRDADEQAIYNACVRSRIGRDSLAARALATILQRFPRLPIMQRALPLARQGLRSLQQRAWSARLATVATPQRSPAVGE